MELFWHKSKKLSNFEGKRPKVRVLCLRVRNWHPGIDSGKKIRWVPEIPGLEYWREGEQKRSWAVCLHFYSLHVSNNTPVWIWNFGRERSTFLYSEGGGRSGRVCLEWVLAGEVNARIRGPSAQTGKGRASAGFFVVKFTHRTLTQTGKKRIRIRRSSHIPGTLFRTGGV